MSCCPPSLCPLQVPSLPHGACAVPCGAQSFPLERWEKTRGEQHPWNDHVFPVHCPYLSSSALHFLCLREGKCSFPICKNPLFNQNKQNYFKFLSFCWKRDPSHGIGCSNEGQKWWSLCGREMGLDPPALSPRRGQKSLPRSYWGLVRGTCDGDG